LTAPNIVHAKNCWIIAMHQPIDSLQQAGRIKPLFLFF